MSNDFDEFESLLAGLPLAAPSEALDEQVAAALRSEPPPRWGWATAATLAASALTAFVLCFPGAASRARRPSPEPPRRFRPAPPPRTERPAPPRPERPAAPPELFQVTDARPLELAGARKVGIVRVPNHGAYYKVIVRRLRRIQWREGPEQVRFSVVRPVEEVVYVPVPVD